MPRLMLVFTADEIRREIAYPLICEVMYGATWDTGTRRRRWAAEFTEAERKACSRLRNQAHRWYLTTGVPDEVTMSHDTLKLWYKLEAFCASL